MIEVYKLFKCMLFKRIWHLDDGRQFGVLEGPNLYTWLTDERLAAEIGWEIPREHGP